jgi:hypothetical protein
MITLYLILWFVFIGLESYRNYYLIEVKKSRPIYIQSFIGRCMAAILHGVLFDPQVMADYAPVFFFQLTSFWILFDLSLNYFRKKPLLYMGEKSGWIDRAFIWLNSDAWLFFCKVLSLVVCVFSIIVICTR